MFSRFLSIYSILGAFFALGAAAYGADPIATSLNLTKENGSLPPWSAPSSSDLSKLSQIAGPQGRSIVLVGHPKAGYGTAFVISKSKRLLATNAHVADIMYEAGSMLAIPNDSSSVMKVEKVWYHPGVLRKLSNGVIISSQLPKDGEVIPQSPDLAVLQLEDGATLPEEIRMASPDSFVKLFGLTVAMIGFPGHDTVAWPQVGELARATYHAGVVCRLTDFGMNASATSEDLQFVQHSMATWFGFSGSPILDLSGNLVAINNSGVSKSQGGLTTTLAYGIRVDSLWELLKYHSIATELIPSGATIKSRNYDPTLRDTAVAQLEKAKHVVLESELETVKRNFTSAVKKAEEAIRVSPQWYGGYAARASAYLGYAEIESLDTDELTSGGIDQVRWAIKDIRMAISLAPTQASAVITYARALMTLGSKQTGKSTNSEVVSLVNKLLEIPSLDNDQRSELYRIRSLARHERGGSLQDLEQALKLSPFKIGNEITLANYFEAVGDSGQSELHRRRGKNLLALEEENSKAYLMAISIDTNQRNGRTALEMATRVCRELNFEYWAHLDTLACAYAEVGDFDSAIKWELKALSLTPESRKQEVLPHLKEFKAKRPWRE